MLTTSSVVDIKKNPTKNGEFFLPTLKIWVVAIVKSKYRKLSKRFMLIKPKLADDAIISRLQNEYDLSVAALSFLPLGADMGTAVYRVAADNKQTYFLKLRKGFNKIVVTVPLL